MELASQQLSAPPVHAAGPSQPTGATRAAGRRETTSTPPTGQGQPPDVHTPADAATPNRERHAPQAPRVCPTWVRSTARQLRAGLLTAGATRYARRMAPSVNQNDHTRWDRSGLPTVGRGVERVQTECLAMKKVFTTGQVA